MRLPHSIKWNRPRGSLQIFSCLVQNSSSYLVPASSSSSTRRNEVTYLCRLPRTKLNITTTICKRLQMENITRLICDSLHGARILSGETFQPFIIITHDENKTTSIYRNRDRNYKHKKGKREKKQESEKNTHNKRIRRFSQIFSARGCSADTKRYAVFQLPIQTRPTTTNGYE